MGAVTMATTALGGLTSLAGNRQATKAAVSSSKYNAREAERQADIFELQAGQAQERGEADRLAYMREFQQEQGLRAAGMGASGVEVGSGSNADVLADSAASAALDASTIRANAGNEAWGYREQARGARQEAGLQRAQAKSAKQAGRMGLVGNLLGTAGSLGSQYNQFGFDWFGGGDDSGGGDGLTPQSSLIKGKEKVRGGSR